MLNLLSNLLVLITLAAHPLTGCNTATTGTHLHASSNAHITQDTAFTDRAFLAPPTPAHFLCSRVAGIAATTLEHKISDPTLWLLELSPASRMLFRATDLADLYGGAVDLFASWYCNMWHLRLKT